MLRAPWLTCAALLAWPAFVVADGTTPVSFEPGDRLIAEAADTPLAAVAEFTVGKGDTLTLEFLPADPGTKVEGMLISAGAIVLPPVQVPFSAKHHPTKTVKKTFEFGFAGTFWLVLSFEGHGTYVVQTGKAYPGKLEGTKSKKLKPKKKGLTASVKIDAAAGSTLDFTLDGKKGFAVPAIWELRSPLGQVIAQGTGTPNPPGEPDVAETGVPLALGGKYTLEVSGFTGKKQRLKLERTLHLPEVSGEDVDLCP